MSRDKTLRRYISGLLILMASLTAMPASQAVAQIFQGEAEPKIFYSDSGAAVENPVTNTDLDNFNISLHYGTMEEDLGDTLFLQDASVSIPVTVSIEYTGEECYNAGDLTFTLKDIEGLSRQGNGRSLQPFAVTTDIGAEKYGSGSNRGDWYYYSEEMENHSNSYVFCNKNDLEGPFTSSVEMISTISHIGTARNGFSQTINSTLSIEGIGDRICRPLYFSNYTSPTIFTMKPFVWEPYKAMWQQETFPCAGSPDDYEIIRICLDFDQAVNSRIFGDTSPDSFQEGSFAQVNIIAPEGIEVMNPDGSFNTPQRICSSSAGDPFLDGLIPESEYIPAPEPEFIAFIPKSLYPAGSSVTITAELHGRYYDDFAPFSTFTTQTIQIPSTADPNAELSPYDSENPDTPISIIDPSETISVSSMVQDIPQWFAEAGGEYNDQHRDKEKKEFPPHEIDLSGRDSLLFDILGRDRIEGCPSWHHQAVRSVEGTRLVVTATTDTNGIQIIEAVERPDKTFVVGLQFHPEVAIRKVLDHDQDADQYMDYATAMSLFQALFDAGEETLDIAA